MSGSTDKSTSNWPGWFVALSAALAFLGINLRQMPAPHPSHVQTATNQGALYKEESATDGETKDIYEPFRRFLGREVFNKEHTFTKNPKAASDPDHALIKQLRNYDSRYLIACIPDPADTRGGYRFDIWLEAVHRAIEIHGSRADKSAEDKKNGAVNDNGKKAKSSHESEPVADDRKSIGKTSSAEPKGYILDQFYLPWQMNPDKKKAENDNRHLPGVLIFRDSFPADVPIKLLIVFLVGDSPTSGIQKESFRWALRFLLQDLKVKSSEHVNPRPTNDRSPDLIRIIGPVYSGSEPSLQMVLQDAFLRESQQPEPIENLHFQAYSSATALHLDEFNCPSEDGKERFDALRGGKLKFLNEGKEFSFEPKDASHQTRPITWTAKLQSTCIADQVALNELLDYVSRQHRFNGQHQGPPKIAVLHESNTGYGSQSVEAGEGYKDSEKLIWAPFPAHVNRIATARKLLSAEEQKSSPKIAMSRNTLQIPDDTDEGVTDMIPLRKPAMTTVVQEFALVQLLNYLKAERVQYVVISATDPRDKLYLAEMLNEYCPDAQILLTLGDLLYTHPSYFPFLGGALVASPYPLSHQARDWGIADPASTQIVFPDYASQAYFNAVLLALQKNEHLLDYKTPKSLEALEGLKPSQLDSSPDHFRPGLWISQVANRHFRPVHFIPYYNLDHHPVGQNLASYTATGLKKPVPENGVNASTTRGNASTPDDSSSKKPLHTGREIPKTIPLGWIAFSMATIFASSYLAIQVRHGLKRLEKGVRRPHRQDIDFSDIVARILPDCELPIPQFVLCFMLAICVAHLVLFVFASTLLVQSVSGLQHLSMASGLLVAGIVLVLALTWFFSRCLVLCYFRPVSRGRTVDLFVGLCLLMLASAVGVYCVQSTLGGPIETLGQLRMHAWQVAEIGGGASPVFACSLLTCLWVAGCYTVLKCRTLIADEQSLSSLTNALVRRFDTATDGAGWYEMVLKDGARTLKALGEFYAKFRWNMLTSATFWARFARARIRHLIVLAIAAILLREPIREWKPVFDWPIVSWLIFVSFVLAILFVLWQAVEMIRLWKLCENLYREMGKLPFQNAWSRLPSGLVRDFMTGLTPSRVRHIVPKYAQQQFARLESLLATRGPALVPIDPAALRKAAQLEHGLLTKQGLWATGVLVVRQLAAGPWNSRDSRTAFEVLPDQKSASPTTEISIQDQINVALEDYLAVVIVLFLSRYQLHLKQRAFFLLASPILLLAAITAYPFQPGVKIVYVIGFVALCVAVSLTIVLTGMNRDPLLSHIGGTKPQLLSFDMDFLGPMLLFVGPMVVIILGQLPVVGPFLQSVVAPFLSLASS